MTDSPNLALAEEIERTIYRIEKLRSIRRGPTVELTNMEYDRIIAALRAQPSGDWVMDAGKAKAVLGESLRADGSIDNLVHYMSWAPGDEKICLDDRFTVEELQAIVFCVLSAAKERG